MPIIPKYPEGAFCCTNTVPIVFPETAYRCHQSLFYISKDFTRAICSTCGAVYHMPGVSDGKKKDKT